MISEHMTGRVIATHLISIIMCTENVMYPECIFQPCSYLVISCRFMSNRTNTLTHPLTSAGSRYVLDSASTGMTSVHPAGKSNFHTDRRQASQHLCSCLSKQELRQTDKNPDKMCQPPKRKSGRIRHGRNWERKYGQGE